MVSILPSDSTINRRLEAVWSLKTSSLLSVTPRNNDYDLLNSLKDDCLGDYLDADDLDDYLDKDDIEEYVEDDDRDNYLKDDDLGDFLEYNDFDDCIEALRTMLLTNMDNDLDD